MAPLSLLLLVVVAAVVVVVVGVVLASLVVLRQGTRMEPGEGPPMRAAKWGPHRAP